MLKVSLIVSAFLSMLAAPVDAATTVTFQQRNFSDGAGRTDGVLDASFTYIDTGLPAYFSEDILWFDLTFRIGSYLARFTPEDYPGAFFFEEGGYGIVAEHGSVGSAYYAKIDTIDFADLHKAVFETSYFTATSNQAPTITYQPYPPPTSAIPEPATWTMMIAGFGIIGTLVRYRRRKIETELGGSGADTELCVR